MKRTILLALLAAAVAVLLTRDVKTHAQEMPGPSITDWFCTQASPNALGASSNVCFQLSNVEMVVPQYRSVYFTSSNELHISDDDWARLCQFAAERHAWKGVIQ